MSYSYRVWRHISVKITPVCLVHYDVGPVDYEVGLVHYDVGPVDYEVGQVYYEVGPVDYEVGPVYYERDSGGARALGMQCTVHVTDADRPSTT